MMLAASEGGAPPNPIIPEMTEVVWGTLSFLILFTVMAKYAYPAIKKTMEARTEKIQNDLDAADTARSEAEILRGEYDSKNCGSSG
jgi:F-type H+-transporting ATPase subunit b